MITHQVKDGSQKPSSEVSTGMRPTLLRSPGQTQDVHHLHIGFAYSQRTEQVICKYLLS